MGASQINKCDVHGNQRLGTKLPRLVRRIVAKPVIKAVLFMKDQSAAFHLFPEWWDRLVGGIRRRMGISEIRPMIPNPSPIEIIVVL